MIELAESLDSRPTIRGHLAVGCATRWPPPRFVEYSSRPSAIRDWIEAVGHETIAQVRTFSEWIGHAWSPPLTLGC